MHLILSLTSLSSFSIKHFLYSENEKKFISYISIVGVIGKNGCGKSTLLSVLMGMKESDSTDTGIVIDGVCLQTDEKEYKKKIAYVFSELPFMEKISAIC